jgi:N,N'-diacetyllegionaminate synthase
MKIIAESAFNHNGDFDELIKLALESKKVESDYFTVQVMNVDEFCVEDYEKYNLYKETEFTENEWVDFFNFCNKNTIKVIPCVLEEKSFQLCYERGFRLIKIHATDITNKPFLDLIASKKDLKIILETQCASMFEVKFAIDILGKNMIEALFTGFSNYPTEVEDLNLNVLDTFRKKYNIPVGFADHSLDSVNIPLMALAKGCKYFEKHITLSRNNRNFDYQVSLYPNEFSVMVNTIRHYEIALGSGNKHPNKNEYKFRNIMYKKKLPQEKTLKRANNGKYLIEEKIDSFDKNNAVVALIARLKSRRLKRKVLLPFHENELIIDLYNRVSKSKKYKTILATSDLDEDKPLIDLFKSKGLNAFKGDAVSVIDRMLSLAYNEKASLVFRVTGDNPFTDPDLMEQMVDLLIENELDYVKVNNAPFGVGAELYSTSYLWRLYLSLESTRFSEYLTWYVLKDMTVRMGSLDLEFKNNDKLINLSVDTQQDFERCKSLLYRLRHKKFHDISLSDIIQNIDNLDFVDENTSIKLPMGCSIKMKTYIEEFNNRQYIIRKTIKVK